MGVGGGHLRAPEDPPPASRAAHACSSTPALPTHQGAAAAGSRRRRPVRLRVQGPRVRCSAPQAPVARLLWAGLRALAGLALVSAQMRPSHSWPKQLCKCLAGGSGVMQGESSANPFFPKRQGTPHCTWTPAWWPRPMGLAWAPYLGLSVDTASPARPPRAQACPPEGSGA